MSKKAKIKRKDAYKTFLNGMVAYRAKFIDRKCRLLEKLLSDETLKNSLSHKKRSELTTLERAALDTLTSRHLTQLEDFQNISSELKETYGKVAKFKYTPKKI